jgi:Fe-S-cluster containining protein
MPEFKFELKIGTQVINASVNLPAEAIRPVDLLPILQGFSNAIVGAAAEGENVSCRVGCGACCRQVVPVSETEAIYLIDLIEEMPAERKAIILARFNDAVSRIATAGLSQKLKPEVLATTQERRNAAEQYLTLRIACPFLENETCGIYEHRPMACREYLVTSPPANCSAPTADSIDMVEMPKRLSYVLYQFGDGVGKAPVKFMPLTLIVGQQFAEQPRLPGSQLFENFFRAAIAPPPPPPSLN